MPSAASTPRDMQDAKPRQYVAPGSRPEHLGAGCKFAHSQEKRLAIDASVGGAEPFRRPAEDAGEIPLGLGAQPQAPTPWRHTLPRVALGDRSLTRIDQMVFQLVE